MVGIQRVIFHEPISVPSGPPDELLDIWYSMGDEPPPEEFSQTFKSPMITSIRSLSVAAGLPDTVSTPVVSSYAERQLVGAGAGSRSRSDSSTQPPRTRTHSLPAEPEPEAAEPEPRRRASTKRRGGPPSTMGSLGTIRRAAPVPPQADLPRFGSPETDEDEDPPVSVSKIYVDDDNPIRPEKPHPLRDGKKAGFIAPTRTLARPPNFKNRRKRKVARLMRKLSNMVATLVQFAFFVGFAMFLAYGVWWLWSNGWMDSAAITKKVQDSGLIDWAMSDSGDSDIKNVIDDVLGEGSDAEQELTEIPDDPDAEGSE